MSKYIGVIALCAFILGPLAFNYGFSKIQSNGVKNSSKVGKEGYWAELNDLCEKSDLCFFDKSTSFGAFSTSAAITKRPEDYRYDYTLIVNLDADDQHSTKEKVGVKGDASQRNVSLDEYCQSSDLCIRRTNATFREMLGSTRLPVAKSQVHFYMTMHKPK